MRPGPRELAGCPVGTRGAMRLPRSACAGARRPVGQVNALSEVGKVSTAFEGGFFDETDLGWIVGPSRIQIHKEVAGCQMEKRCLQVPTVAFQTLVG